MNIEALDKKVDSSDVEYSIENLRNIQELIRFIDQKAAAILVIYGFVVTVFMAVSEKLTVVNPLQLSFVKGVHSVSILIAGLLALSSLIYQIYYIVMKILKPRLANNYKKDEYSSFYFEHIASIPKKEFSTILKKISNEEKIEHLATQLHEISKIMKIKSERLSKSFEGLLITIGMLIIYILLLKLL